MKIITLPKILACTIAGIFCNTQAQIVVKSTLPQEIVLAKNYYASYLLSKSPAMAKIIANRQLNDVLKVRQQRFDDSKNCRDAACYLSAFKWTATEIESIKNIFAVEYSQNSELQKLTDSGLIPSKTYGLARDTPKNYFLKALAQDLEAENNIIDIYGGGKKPNYPNIDSISFNVKNKDYLPFLDGVRQELVSEKPSGFDITKLAAVRLLETNERWNAAAFEPLEKLENKTASDKILMTDFAKFPYSAILVLGAGPELPGQPLSPDGMLRTRTAANYYRQGLAPFIIVSGGKVHPYKTEFAEALEMKKYLVETLGIPGNAVLIEPFARHTTTNMRNAARMMFSYKFPKNKKALVTSSAQHIDYVETKMAKRCIDELGYVPYTLGKRLTENLLEFMPSEEAFRINPSEPMDP